LLTLFRQINNDDNNRKNNFDYQNSIIVKLSEDEVGDFIRVVRTNGSAKFYHTFEGSVTTGSFTYYCIPSKEQGKPDRAGFGLSVTKGDSTIKVGFSNGAAERFMEYLRFNLYKAFGASFLEDVAKDKKFRDGKQSAPKESPAVDRQPNPADEF
jgi:hypothetical protein